MTDPLTGEIVVVAHINSTKKRFYAFYSGVKMAERHSPSLHLIDDCQTGFSGLINVYSNIANIPYNIYYQNVEVIV